MAKYIGVAWASKGWFGVILGDDESWDADLFPSLWSLWKYHSDARRICLDIPIGLPSDGRRQCDVDAKEKLGTHRQRIFYAPVRDAVYEGNIEDAKAINEAAGYSIQNQAWSIVPRIREVDEFLDVHPGGKDRLAEVRPELCFYALNGHAPVAESPFTEAGRRRRAALLADEHPDPTTIYERCVERFLEPPYASFLSATADVIDALAAAVTARRSADDLARLPKRESPLRDGRGIPMEIVYPSEINQTRLSTLAESE